MGKKRTALKFFQGCLVVLGVLLVSIVMMVVTFQIAGPPEHEARVADLEQPIRPLTQGQLRAEGLAAEAGFEGHPAVAVNILMEEGEFFIKPGPPNSTIRVEGDYDAGTHDLKQEFTEDGDGNPVYNLRFRPRYSMLSRLLREGIVHMETNANRLTVYLPQEMPMTLDARISKAESEFDLSGLALEKARFDLSMGEHRVVSADFNPIEMTSLDLRASMGEFDLQGIGNLRAESITIWGKMGELDIDMGREIRRDTSLFTRMRMGELTVGLPAGADLNIRSSVFLGDHSGGPPQGETGGEYRMDIDVGLTMGELRYQPR